jgi:hypothetical protein
MEIETKLLMFSVVCFGLSAIFFALSFWLRLA